jgi:hypothetical protein
MFYNIQLRTGAEINGTEPSLRLENCLMHLHILDNVCYYKTTVVFVPFRHAKALTMSDIKATALVRNKGSAMCKAGFADDEAPRTEFPSIASRP